MTSNPIPGFNPNLHINVLQLLMDNARDHAIILMASQRRIAVWNRGAEHLLGWREDEIRGQSADIFFTPEDRANRAPEHETEQTRLHGRAEDERWHVHKDGSRFWGSGLVYPLDPQGSTGYVKIFRDRTREHEEQQCLADTTRLLTAILDQLPDPLYLKDRAGVFQVCNRALADLVGVSAEQMLGRDASAFFPAATAAESRRNDLAIMETRQTQQVKDDVEVTHVSIRKVLERLLPSLQDVSGGRTIEADIEDMTITLHKTAALTLLVNECVSNAIKHSKGNVSISLCRENENARLEVCDDGDGFPQDFDPRKAANTGLELIDSAARWELRGEVHYENNSDNGGRVVVTFSLESSEDE